MVGLFTWLGCLAVLTAQLREQPFRDTDPQRRFLLTATGVGLGSLVVGALGRKAGAHRRAVDAARRSLRLTGVTSPPVPKGAEVGLSGIEAWQTPVEPLLPDRHVVRPAVARSRRTGRSASTGWSTTRSR